jgi:hypothetical protein
MCSAQVRWREMSNVLLGGIWQNMAAAKAFLSLWQVAFIVGMVLGLA